MENRAEALQVPTIIVLDGSGLKKEIRG